MRASRWRSFVGYEIRDRKEKRLGKITAIEWDGEWFATVNDDFEVSLNGAVEMIELTTGKTYIRVK